MIADASDNGSVVETASMSLAPLDVEDNPELAQAKLYTSNVKIADLGNSCWVVCNPRKNNVSYFEN
jgi:hypothetical protein